MAKKKIGIQNGEITITDNTGEFLDALPEALKAIGEAIGLQAAGYAQGLAPVDTGLLRNSIAYALSGEQPSLGAFGNGKQQRTYKANRPDENGVLQKGTYSGHAPDAEHGGLAVYIGSNVSYAPYQELGTRRTPAKPFLRPAVEEHRDEYRQIALKIMKDAPEG